MAKCGAEKMLVVAIDFGTTYSGYAFQFRHDYNSKDPTKIHTPQAWNGGKQQLMSLKTPTVLLLDEHRNIVSFGYEAENQYTDLCTEEDGRHKKYFYFRRFKMALQNTENLNQRTEIADEMGKKLPAMEVFAKSIECLKNHLLEMLVKRGTGVGEGEILWVLTVPAIWDDAAKIFMRNAAKQAGIENDQLIIALEPEAASLYCQYLPVEKFSTGGKVCFSDAGAGTTYMMVDLGGGTADMTVHEKLTNGKLKEVYRASGGPWGGTAVDGEFLKMMGNIVGGPQMAEYMRNEKYDYLDLMREFEAVKRTVSATTDNHLTIKMPASLNEFCRTKYKKEFKELVKIARLDKKINLLSDKIRLDPDLVRGLFRKVTDKIIYHMRNILDNEPEGKSVSLILMVGGFSESQYVQDVIKKAFHEKNGRTVLIPRDAGISVLNGAVIFGRHPDNITGRILRFSYGVKTSPDFDDSVHEQQRMFVSNNQARCSDVFCKFIEAGTPVDAGHQVQSVYTTTTPFQQQMGLRIYVSENSSPRYIDESGCRCLGQLDVDVPNPSEEEHNMLVIYEFGNTELTVLAIELESKQPCIAKLSLPE